MQLVILELFSQPRAYSTSGSFSAIRKGKAPEYGWQDHPSNHPALKPSCKTGEKTGANQQNKANPSTEQSNREIIPGNFNLNIVPNG